MSSFSWKRWRASSDFWRVLWSSSRRPLSHPAASWEAESFISRSLFM